MTKARRGPGLGKTFHLGHGHRRVASPLAAAHILDHICHCTHHPMVSDGSSALSYVGNLRSREELSGRGVTLWRRHSTAVTCMLV